MRNGIKREEYTKLPEQKFEELKQYINNLRPDRETGFTPSIPYDCGYLDGFAEAVDLIKDKLNELEKETIDA